MEKSVIVIFTALENDKKGILRRDLELLQASFNSNSNDNSIIMQI